MAAAQHWDLLARRPHPAVRAAVSDYQGYRESVVGGGILRRREVPHSGITLIINLGPPFGVGDIDAITISARSFVAGLWTRAAITETRGEMEGIEVRLTPLGAYRLFRHPMHLLADTVVDLEDLAGAGGRSLVARLRETDGWGARFAVLDAALLAWFTEGRARDVSGVQWAWGQIERSAGRAPVGALATSLGWSRKRMIAEFHEQVGLAPKRVARVFRFQRAIEGMRRPAVRWTALAADAGYYDQAHLIREVRELAGVTPTELVRQFDPNGLGIIFD
jgi:AraC-like DNA-binding protein